MIRGSAVEAAGKMMGKIDERYSLTMKQVVELRNHYERLPFTLIYASFCLGYGEGIKAEKEREAKNV